MPVRKVEYYGTYNANTFPLSVFSYRLAGNYSVVISTRDPHKRKDIAEQELSIRSIIKMITTCNRSKTGITSLKSKTSYLLRHIKVH